MTDSKRAKHEEHADEEVHPSGNGRSRLIDRDARKIEDVKHDHAERRQTAEDVRPVDALLRLIVMVKGEPVEEKRAG